MTTNCSQCRHSSVCKHIEAYKTFIRKVNDLLEAFGKERPDNFIFDLEATCKFCEEDVPLVRSTHVEVLNDGFSSYKNEPCDSCPNKPDASKGTIIGDSPCQWCAHYPFKLTCK